jgi:hypothetical protein
MINKKLLITISFLFIILLFQTYPIVADNSKQMDIADLELITFESWWSHLNNGTIYIRFLVINSGQTYHNSIEPFVLNISLKKDADEIPFSYINQQSFIDPFTWFVGETLGGCYQIFNISKPNTITADVNFNQAIPENNISNNQKTTNVSNSIIIYGQVTKRINSSKIPTTSITIRRCNASSLQSSLYISFSTNEDGHYIACLYPNQLSNINDPYSLLFIDDTSSKTIVKEFILNTNQQVTSINVTFPEFQLNTPVKPIGRVLGFQNDLYTYRTLVFNNKINAISFKFQWDQNSYSPWLNSSGFIPFVKSRHAWDTKGLHAIKVLAKNKDGLISSWSKPSTIFIM